MARYLGFGLVHLVARRRGENPMSVLRDSGRLDGFSLFGYQGSHIGSCHSEALQDLWLGLVTRGCEPEPQPSQGEAPHGRNQQCRLSVVTGYRFPGFDEDRAKLYLTTLPRSMIRSSRSGRQSLAVRLAANEIVDMTGLAREFWGRRR
jgi:hypothetical protein